MEHTCTLHPETVLKVRASMRPEEQLDRMSTLLKVLGDGTRLRIVNALLVSEMCVCDLAHLLGMEHSAVSHQLAVLRTNDIVQARQSGKVKYYSLSDSHIATIFCVTHAHITE